jgi:hypothetical protein
MYKWLFIIVLIAGCKGPSSVPGNVLGYNDMKEIMWDMVQTDEFVTVYVHGTPQNIKDENLALYQKVFALHKITNNEFTKSYGFYKTHPIQQKILMDSLMQFSTRLRQERLVSPNTMPLRPSVLINPAPMKIGNMMNDWHQYQLKTTYWNE